MSYRVILVTRPPEEICSQRCSAAGRCSFCTSDEGQLAKEFRLHKAVCLENLRVFRVCKRCRSETMKPADKARKARGTLTLVEEDMFLWKDQDENELF